MDIDPLLQPVSSEFPCGPDIDDYDSQRESYEAFSDLKAKLEGEMKNGILQPPRWPEIQKTAFDLAIHSKHLHLAVILTESALMNEGLAGFRDGLRLIRHWAQEFWADLYPREVRHTLIDVLSNSRFLLKPRRVPIAKAAGGSFSFEDHEKALEDQQSADSEVSNHARLVVGVFRDTSKAQHTQNLSILQDTLDQASQIESIFDTNGGSDESVNLVNLRDLLSKMIDVLTPLAQDTVEDASDAAPPLDGTILGLQDASTGVGGKVSSRDQAAEQLERIARFFEQNEPSSPLPYLLRRARRCIGKNFMELIDELASDKGHAVQVLSPEGPPQVSSNE